MTTLQDLDAAEAEFHDHCRNNIEAGLAVYNHDSAQIDVMATKIATFAKGMAADLASLHARDNPTPPAAVDIAQLVAEALDRDLNLEAARLLYAQVRYQMREGA